MGRYSINFCIDREIFNSYIAVAFLREVDIESSSTITHKNNLKFAQCSNSRCQSIFIYDTSKKSTDTNFLCPVCHDKLHTHHIVQCSYCQSIINFIKVDEGEEPVVFYVNKCHHCHGSFEDERRLQPFIYPELFI